MNRRPRGETARRDRPRLLHARAATAAVSPRPLADLDWHRLLDAAILISRPERRSAGWK